MGIILNLAYRLVDRHGNRTVPANLYNVAAQMAPALKRVGFDGVQFFPFTVSQSGTADNADGYGKRFDYRLSPTRFGTIDELMRAVACLNAAGMDAGSDEVIHQYDGGENGTYLEIGADGKLGSGRFPKYPWCFVGAPPRSPVDPVFDSQGNFAFGDMVSYIHSGHDGYMLKGMTAAVVWKAKRTGVKFFRLDDTKGENIAVSRDLVGALNAVGMYGYGECFVGNTQELETWEGDLRGRAGTLDFPLHWALVNACNGYNANALAGQGLCLQNPGAAWKFRDNGDTDTTPGEAVIANALLANIRILTAPGENVLIYGKDWLPQSEGGYGLSHWLTNQVWIAKNLAFGDEIQRYGNDNSVAVFERLGYPGLLTALNFDTWNTRKVTVQTNFGPGVQLWDYTGRHATIWTDGNGRATFTIPSNAYSSGQSYLCFSRSGYAQGFQLQPRATVQTIAGARDLDIGPATAKSTAIGRIWCAEGEKVSATSAQKIAVSFDGPAGKSIKSGDKAPVTGWYSVLVSSEDSKAVDFEVKLEYMGSAGIEAGE